MQTFGGRLANTSRHNFMYGAHNCAHDESSQSVSTNKAL